MKQEQGRNSENREESLPEVTLNPETGEMVIDNKFRINYRPTSRTFIGAQYLLSRQGFVPMSEIHAFALAIGFKGEEDEKAGNALIKSVRQPIHNWAHAPHFIEVARDDEQRKGYVVHAAVTPFEPSEVAQRTSESIITSESGLAMEGDVFEEVKFDPVIPVSAKSIGIIVAESNPQMQAALAEEQSLIELHERVMAAQATPHPATWQEHAVAFREIATSLIEQNDQPMAAALREPQTDADKLASWLINNNLPILVSMFSDFYYDERTQKQVDYISRTALLLQYEALRNNWNKQLPPERRDEMIPSLMVNDRGRINALEAKHHLAEEIDAVLPGLTTIMSTMVADVARGPGPAGAKVSTFELRKPVRFARKWDRTFFEEAARNRLLPGIDPSRAEFDFMSQLRLNRQQVLVLHVWEMYKDELADNPDGMQLVRRYVNSQLEDFEQEEIIRLARRAKKKPNDRK